MHSLRGWKWVVLGGMVGTTSCAAVPAPVITRAPEPGVEALIKRQEPDAISFAQVLLTAIPLSLRQIAATNAPAVSSILWEEFLDDKKPQWFLELPWEIQSYLVVKFGPQTAWPSATQQTTLAQVTPTGSASLPISTPTLRSSRTTLSMPYSSWRSSTQSITTSLSSSMTSATVVSSTLSTSTRSSKSTSISSSANSFASSSSLTKSASSTSTSSPSAAANLDAPLSGGDGLTRGQKIGLGVGIPLGIFGLAALLCACGFLCGRRRNRRHVNGSEPPSSPGCIPRFAFQDKSTDHFDHRAPLNPTHNQSSRDLGTMNWEDDGYDPYVPTYASTAHMATTKQVPTSPPSATPPMAMQDTKPIMAPVLHHTHSSNRARGKRTSYSSLHSVAELSEPEDNMESPILGRQTTPLQRKRRPSLPMVLEMPSAPRSATIKRKPIPQSPTDASPAAQAASDFLLRPTMRHVDYSGSSSSGLAFSTDSSNGDYHTGPASPVSPVSQLASTNPFSNDYSYVEDYGPEYQSGYGDQQGDLYGGHRNLDRYPDPSPPRRNSLKTEWPLRNLSMGRRNRSPMWDRVYESP